MKKLVIAAALMAAAPVFAQTTAHSQFYIGLDGGYVDLKVPEESPPGGFNGRFEFKKKTSAARLFSGYQFTPNWSAELGYLSTSSFSVRLRDDNGTMDGNGKISGFELSGVYKFTEGAPGLFLKAGITQFKSKGTNRDTAAGTGVVTTNSFSDSGSGLLFGIGYEVPLTPQLNGRVGFTRYQKVAGESGANLNALYLGLKYAF